MSADQKYDILLTFPAEKIRFFDFMIPLGLASIAALLEKHDYRVKIIDFNFYKGDFRRDLEKWEPKVVGIGGTTPTRKGSFLTAQLTKEVIPDVPTVYGGNHATFAVQDTLQQVPVVDYIIKGEGELSFLSFCEKLVRNRPVDLESIPGLCWRKNGSFYENQSSRIQDLDSLPVPARHLFGDEYDLTLDFYGLPADFLMTSRGCPAACSFCSAARMFPGGVRYRSISSVQEEVELVLSRKNIKALKLFDSTFTASREHVIQFCRMIKPYGLLWECEVRADTVDRDLLRIMKEAGCAYIDVGLETTNARLLKDLGKKITVRQVEQVLDWCRELGIRTKLFFIFGLLGETYEECQKDLRFIRQKKDKIDFFANSIGLKVYPGTRLEKQVKEKQLMKDNFSWARYNPPMKNLMFLEPADVFILEQKQLSYFKLFWIATQLHLQRTNLSPGFIIKMMWNNLKSIIDMLICQARYYRHNAARKLDRIQKW